MPKGDLVYRQYILPNSGAQTFIEIYDFLFHGCYAVPILYFIIVFALFNWNKLGEYQLLL